jgi:hypothetical protein
MKSSSKLHFKRLSKDIETSLGPSNYLKGSKSSSLSLQATKHFFENTKSERFQKEFAKGDDETFFDCSFVSSTRANSEKLRPSGFALASEQTKNKSPWRRLAGAVFLCFCL